MKLEILYPEISGMFGDSMNPEILLRAVPELEAVKTAISEPPAFTNGGVDMVYLGAMTERAQELSAGLLTPYRSAIEEEIKRGTIFLVTGNAMEIFGKYIENEDGTKIETLSIFDFYSKRNMFSRHNSLYLGKFEKLDIVGFNSRFSHMYTDDDGIAPLFETIRGTGRAPGTSPLEGILRNNFMATYIAGPLLALNPLFLEYIIKLLGAESYNIPFEESAMDAYKKRLAEFRDPKTVERF